jgi:hypothetical protein
MGRHASALLSDAGDLECEKRSQTMPKQSKWFVQNGFEFLRECTCETDEFFRRLLPESARVAGQHNRLEIKPSRQSSNPVMKDRAASSRTRKTEQSYSYSLGWDAGYLVRVVCVYHHHLT